MRIKTILAGATALLAAAGAAQALTVNVVGNLGITTQSKTLEAPFWNEKLPEISGGEITANFKPWNEMGLKGPEIYRLLGQGVMNVATGQLGHSAGDVPINDATDLAGLNPTIEEFKAVTEAFRPTLSKYYAEEMGLDAGLLCPSRYLLQAVVSDPATPEELAEALGLRRWQWDLLADAFTEAMFGEDEPAED